MSKYCNYYITINIKGLNEIINKKMLVQLNVLASISYTWIKFTFL